MKIGLAIAALLAASAATAAPIDTPIDTQRKQFVECLRQAVDKARTDRLAPAGFEALARQRCSGELGAFRSALVAFDVKAGSPRKRAEQDADTQIGDYLVGASEKLDPGS